MLAINCQLHLSQLLKKKTYSVFVVFQYSGSICTDPMTIPNSIKIFIFSSEIKSLFQLKFFFFSLQKISSVSTNSYVTVRVNRLLQNFLFPNLLKARKDALNLGSAGAPSFQV